MTATVTPVDFDQYVESAVADATHAFNFLKESGTLAASLIFNVAHRIPGHDKLLSLRFPQPWHRDQTITRNITVFSESKEHVLHESRLDADTLVHAHTPYLAAWSSSHRPFPILYVAAARHVLAREIPNHLERTRSVLDVIRERLDKYPELAPPPGLLESNGPARQPQRPRESNDMSNSRNSEFAIDPIFLDRWSPRAFTGEAIDQPTLFTLFEAARWAPSANNSQPWRFIYALKDSPNWAVFLSLLNHNNQRWAANASALVVLVSKTTHVRNGDSEPSHLRNHSFDSGAAWANLALQALHSGWRTHAIGGFNRDKARDTLGVPEGYSVEVAIAIGKLAERDSLPPDLQEREKANHRMPLGKFVTEGRFSFAE